MHCNVVKYFLQKLRLYTMIYNEYGSEKNTFFINKSIYKYFLKGLWIVIHALILVDRVNRMVNSIKKLTVNHCF